MIENLDNNKMFQVFIKNTYTHCRVNPIQSCSGNKSMLQWVKSVIFYVLVSFKRILQDSLSPSMAELIKY